MTIALGVLAGDYVVLAADTMESTGYAGNLQTAAAKISCGACTNTNGSAAIGITGAGDSGYLDAIKQEVIKTFIEEDMTLIAFEAYFRRRLVNFYREHVVPFAQFPAGDRPSFDLLIAVQRDCQSILLSTDRTTVTKKSFPNQYGAVGAGSLYARQMLARLFVPSVSVNLARALSAYIVFAVKTNVEGCGKHTHIVTLLNNRVTYIHASIIQELERLFEEYDSIEARAFWHAIGYDSQNTSPADDLTKVSDWLKELRGKIEQLCIQM
jgi:hypothetical protein